MTSFVKNTIKANGEIFKIFWLPLIVFLIAAVFAPLLALLMFGALGMIMLLSPETIRKIYIRMLSVNERYSEPRFLRSTFRFYQDEAENKKSMVYWRIRLLGFVWTVFFLAVLFGYLGSR